MANGKKVLLIEDDHDIANSASLRLQAAGYETHIVATAEEGLARAIQWNPDVIVLDIRLPGMDGLEALRHLRAQQQTQLIPIVALSASVVDQRSALDGGARFFLKKPYEPTEFVRAIDVAVSSVAMSNPAKVFAAGDSRGDAHDVSLLAGPLVRTAHSDPSSKTLRSS